MSVLIGSGVRHVYICRINTLHHCLGRMSGYYNAMQSCSQPSAIQACEAPYAHHYINAIRNAACMKQLLTPSALQDFARNQVGALADSVLAVEPGGDDADADAVDAGSQQLGGLHMSDAGSTDGNQLYWRSRCNVCCLAGCVCACSVQKAPARKGTARTQHPACGADHTP